MRLFSERKFSYKIFLFLMLLLSLLLWHSSCCCLYFNSKLDLSTSQQEVRCFSVWFLECHEAFCPLGTAISSAFIVSWSLIVIISNRFVEILSKIKNEFYETFVRVEYSFSRCNIIFEKWKKTVEMHSFFFETFFK